MDVIVHHSDVLLKHKEDLMNEYETVYLVCYITNKNCYTYKEARTLINWCKSKHMKGYQKFPIREYFCDYCNKYHVTSKKLGFYS